jgi:hypothetical protein
MCNPAAHGTTIQAPPLTYYGATGWEAVDRYLRAFPTPDHVTLCRVASEIERLRREEATR